MTWPIFVAHLLAGMFLTNGIPHFVQGISGRPFPSPFASPPGIGPSAPIVNVLWGSGNLLLGYLLLTVGDVPRWGTSASALALALGVLLMGLTLASWFGRPRQGGN